MIKRDLRAHKATPKRLTDVPTFKPQARNKLPKPFKKLGGERIRSTGMLEVSDDHVAFMFWRDGALLTDRSFYGYLFARLAEGRLGPVFEFHWHPSHKPIHCKVPCKTTSDFTDRTLRQAPELELRTSSCLDPKNPEELAQLVVQFCNSCGIDLPDNDPNTMRLC